MSLRYYYYVIIITSLLLRHYYYVILHYSRKLFCSSFDLIFRRKGQGYLHDYEEDRDRIRRQPFFRAGRHQLRVDQHSDHHNDPTEWQMAIDRVNFQDDLTNIVSKLWLQ